MRNQPWNPQKSFGTIAHKLHGALKSPVQVGECSSSDVCLLLLVGLIYFPTAGCHRPKESLPPKPNEFSRFQQYFFHRRLNKHSPFSPARFDGSTKTKVPLELVAFNGFSTSAVYFWGGVLVFLTAPRSVILAR